MIHSPHQLPILCALLLSKMPLYTDLFENEEVGQGTSKTSTLKPRNSIASIKFPSNLISKDSMKVLQFVKAQAKEAAEK